MGEPWENPNDDPDDPDDDQPHLDMWLIPRVIGKSTGLAAWGLPEIIAC
jgi:hypothetical protein